MECNPQIELYQNNGRYYSIYGYLNVSADTQFIRIEQLRDSMPTSAPGHLNITVKLTDLNSDNTVTLRDSLVHFETGDAHDYYTTEQIIPDHTYKLVVDGPDGAQSSAQVKAPALFPKPKVAAGIDPFFGLGCSNNSNIMAEVSVSGVKRLVAVNVIYYTLHTTSVGQQRLNRYSIEHLADTTHPDQQKVVANINYHLDICRTDLAFNSNSSLHWVYVVVAAGNQDWPDFLNMDSETQAEPGIATNVKGGVGLLGAVVTDTVAIYRYDQPTLFSN